MPHPIPTAISTATEMLTTNIVYAYGFKYEPITPTKINTLASMYPTVYTPAIKTMTLNKVGKIGIDCSGFICKAFGIPHIGSSQLKSQMTHLYPTSDPSRLVNGMLIWRSGHIGLIEIDDTGEAWILEAKSTADDLVRTKYSARGNSFTYYGELTGVDYTNARKINSPTQSSSSTPRINRYFPSQYNQPLPYRLQIQRCNHPCRLSLLHHRQFDSGQKIHRAYQRGPVQQYEARLLFL